MNEREQPADEFERAPKDSDQNSASGEPFHEPTEQAELAVRSEHAVQSELASAYSRRSRRAADTGPTDRAASLFPADSPAHPDARHTEFRVRDFRPARNDFAALSDTAVQAEAPRAEPMRDVPRWTPPATDDDGRLSYYTQGVPMPSGHQAPPAVVNSVPAEFAAPPRPMTRRQLRELEVSQGVRPQADDAPAAVPEAAVPEAVAPEAAAPATPSITAPPVLVSPTAAAPAPAQPAQLSPAPVLLPAMPSQPATPPPPAMPPVIRLAPPVPVPVPTPQSAPREFSPEPVIFTDVSGSAPSNRAPVAPQPAAPVSLAASRGIDSAPLVFTSPDVHAPQAPIDAAIQPGDSFIRSVGGSSGSFTTSALVIPSIPQAADITRPFSSTGEILVTGSIDLPMSLASTGANSSRYDHSDIDALFAQEDHDYAPADSAPVRAIRAVSTHTSTHGVISAKKPANNRLPMLMAVTAGILAVGVAALFAAGMIFGYF